jgi:hypothetical protein
MNGELAYRLSREQSKQLKNQLNIVFASEEQRSAEAIRIAKEA